MATEATFQSPPAASAFPTPSTTPKRPPSMHARAGSSPGPISSPASLPNHVSSPGERSDFDDIVDEDVISPLDPRRFTPTLHASLVSEILALRRDVESKTKGIDVLERTLDESRIENEEIAERLSKQSRESRSLKHQLQLLEGGSSSALNELSKERDDALEGIAEIRRKFEQAQKKAKNREDELERTTKIWSRDREAWDGERRNLERKIHVVEGRLKVVLNEVAAQSAGSLEPASNAEGPDIMKESSTGKDSDSASIHSSSQGRHRTSVTSMSSAEPDDDGFHNVRYSVMSTANMPGSQTNLAQELAFDEEDAFDLDDDMVPMSPEELPEERPASVHSQLSHKMGMDAKARKILGLSLNESVDGYAMRMEQTAELRNSVVIPGSSFEYQDTGVQYSPPPSPTLTPVAEMPVEEEKVLEAPVCQAKDNSTLTLTIDMVSSACQTIDDLPTPPWTPKVVEPPAPPVVEPVAVVSASVQTDSPSKLEVKHNLTESEVIKSANIEIPMIAIHPPQSEPSSPRGSVVLPPQTKSVSCQADFKPVVDSRTIGIQTEPIRVDQRPVKLPASLLPSAIQDLPLSTATQDHIQPYQTFSPRTVKSGKKPPSLVVETRTDAARPRPLPVQAYPGNNDNGPLSGNSKANLRRPPRSSSLFAGFEQGSDEESPEAIRDVFTDDDFLNRPFAAYKLRRGKMVSSHERRRSLDGVALPEVDEDLDPEVIKELRSSPPSSRSRSGSRQQDIRRAAMISSGAATHQRRARTPSEPSIDSGSGSNASSVAPPFPVPIRLSSRKFPLTESDGRQSPTPSRNFSDRPRPSIVRRPTLRRVRSAAAMSQTETERPPTRSSPAMSISSYVSESSQHPPMPFDDITMPRHRRSIQASRRPSASQHLAHERHGSTATTVQPTSVVDAIAQTMVGEWMWKYVRKRRSFGGDKDNWEGRNAEDVSASITNSGVRHKRWVWLAPYERAVMWSSKQPTSGPALLGKSGRKLVIQSVLDVKDDNPLPKGFNGPVQFNRSILILTPQRALKFTATSIERHYVWLTALSFLSHSAMGVQDLAALPPIPQEEYARPAPTATLRRNPIRDSIRIAKGRPRPFPKGKKSALANNHPEPVPELPAHLEAGDRVSEDAAVPPTVPRFANHSRKRSNTAPRMPIPNIRSFSSQNTIPSMRSSPDPVASSSHSHGFNSVRSSFSHRTSETNSVRTGNFFDAIGTVRMEAFIDQTDSNRHRPPARRHARKASTPWSMNQGFPELESPYEETGLLRNDDPFRGF
ncbi:meiotic cell cortex C-terminal pleckstrin homology-domain-containing protein [Aspergillus californicus]